VDGRGVSMRHVERSLCDLAGEGYAFSIGSSCCAALLISVIPADLPPHAESALRSQRNLAFLAHFLRLSDNLRTMRVCNSKRLPPQVMCRTTVQWLSQPKTASRCICTNGTVRDAGCRGKAGMHEVSICGCFVDCFVSRCALHGVPIRLAGAIVKTRNR
jgi:hypothetical protein